jgi:hypothetical protein
MQHGADVGAAALSEHCRAIDKLEDGLQKILRVSGDQIYEELSHSLAILRRALAERQNLLEVPLHGYYTMPLLLRFNRARKAL